MNKIPSILVDTGFEVDQNGALEEIVIPQVVVTCNAPRKVTFEGQTLNYVPSAAAALQEFDAPNCTSINNNTFYNFTSLTSVSFGSLQAISNSSPNLFYGCTNLLSADFPDLETITNGGNGSGLFKNCSKLASINMPKLKSIVCTDGNGTGTFAGCTAITSIEFPSLETIQSGDMFPPFYGLTQITTINLPKLKIASTSNTNWGAFYGLSGLRTVTLGSEGNPVLSLAATTFKNCTQSGLTITIYTQGGVALPGSPWGATNTQPNFVEA